MEPISVTAKDGLIISALAHGFDLSDIKAIVIILHGFGEHSGSYNELAERLYASGFATIVPSQRGHGEPPEGSKRWHGKIPSYQCFMDDVLSLTEYARATLPGVPIALYGHSMGGNIATNTLLHMPHEQAKEYVCAVLESPWFELYEPVGAFMTFVLRAMKKIAPNFRIEYELKAGNLSSIATRADGYVKDPLYHGYLSTRMLVGIFDACNYIKIHAPRFPIPAFVAYASDEVVVCNETIGEFAKKVGDLVETKEYESKHAIHNDESREQLFDDVIAYICSKLPA